MDTSCFSSLANWLALNPLKGSPMIEMVRTPFLRMILPSCQSGEILASWRSGTLDVPPITGMYSLARSLSFSDFRIIFTG
ncbi:Uncharacterised protein [Segatella copri]|nr:Uncharacterised protein [Segatella copri]